MQQAVQHTTTSTAIRRVLVVDDGRLQRRILSSMLTRWGFEVFEAEDAFQALSVCKETYPDLVFSDWMMPGLTGLEFCKQFRQLHPDHYSYFILLTSKSEKNDIAMGLETGADDFLAKPVNAHELRARITAGERILSMERELHSRNAIITDTLSELRKLYHAIDIDLIEAKKLQHSLIREPNVSVGSYKITQFLQSAGHVGGIWLACFPRVSDIWDCLELMCRAMASARLSLRRVWRAIYPLARQSITSHLVQVRMASLGRCPPRKCLRP